MILRSIQRLTTLLLLLVTSGICSGTTSPVLHSSAQQKDALEKGTPMFSSPQLDSLLENKDYFWRDVVIGSVAIAVGNLAGIWSSTTDLESPVNKPKGRAGAIFFALATAVYVFGCIWLIRAIVRKIKSRKHKRKRAKKVVG